MKHRRMWQGSIILCISMMTFSLGHSQTISFNEPVLPGLTINVTGVANETLSIYLFPAGAAAPANCNNPGVAAGTQQLSFTAAAAPTYTLKSSTEQITLSAPVPAGQYLCLNAQYPTAGGAGTILLVSKPVLVNPPAAAPSVSIQGNPSAGSVTISVLSSVPAFVQIIAFPYQYGGAVPPGACAAADLGNPVANLLQISVGGTPAAALSIPGGAAQTITLVNPLPVGARLCAITFTPGAGATTYSKYVDVQASNAVSPSVNGDLATSSASPTTQISVYGEPSTSLAIYQLDDHDKHLGCAVAIANGKTKQLQVASAGSSAAPTYTANLGSGPGPFAITLSNPLTAGTDICLEQWPNSAAGAGPSQPQYSSAARYVEDLDNPYPMLRTFYTAGAMINNLNGTSSSSTGAEYLDIGLAITQIASKGKWHWNWGSSISGRFSSIPVTAPSNGVTTSSTPAPDSGTLNILSSQESVRVLGSNALSFGKLKTHGYNPFFGPVVKAGIDTLLNPSATANSGASGSTTAVAEFAPVYSEFSGGFRMGLRHFNSSTDRSPRTVAQFDITIGKFSNMQSLVCNPNVIVSTPTAQPTNTLCYTPQTTGAPSYNLEQQSRITLLRPEVDGFINLGNSNFVLGLDANLPQSVDAPKHLDVQNKAGGSVIIYFGYSGSLTGLFNSLKLSGSSQ